MSATYEAFLSLGNSSVAISTTGVPLVVRTECGDVAAPTVFVTLMVPERADSSEPVAEVRLLRP